MTLKMTTAQVVETSVTVTNSSFQNYTHPDDHTRQTTAQCKCNSSYKGNMEVKHYFQVLPITMTAANKKLPPSHNREI